jgi:hypothetical protein
MTAQLFPQRPFQVSERPAHGEIYVLLKSTFSNGNGHQTTSAPMPNVLEASLWLDRQMNAITRDNKARGVILRYMRHSVPEFDMWAVVPSTGEEFSDRL